MMRGAKADITSCEHALLHPAYLVQLEHQNHDLEWLLQITKHPDEGPGGRGGQD